MTCFRNFLAAVLLSAALARAQEVRTWTSARGATLEASFVSESFGQVVLQRPDGEQMRIRLNQLSSADQAYVGQQRTGSPAASAGTSEPGEAEAPPALEELLGSRLENAKGHRVSPATLAGKKIGLYFSASWCPPCRKFTPMLIEAYNQLQAEGKPFEVVLVTHDRDKASMRNYMKSHDMPWLAVPFGRKPIDALKEKYAVAGIPKLVIINDAGETLSTDARGPVMTQGAAADESW